MIRCGSCRRGLNRTEEKKRIEFHLVGGGEVAFGLNVTGHPLDDPRALGTPITRVLHRKCWFAEKSHSTVEAARARSRAEGAADPIASDREPQDWRPQRVAEVEDLIGEGD
jgi:hypothetical protein